MTNERTRPLIAVYGSAQPQPGDELYEEAYRLGRLLAEAGFDVMSGGYYGTMAAVSRGAHEGGGRVVGVTMAIFDPRPPNEWVHETTHTPGFPERLRTLTEMADAYIALRGGRLHLGADANRSNAPQALHLIGGALAAAPCPVARR